MKSIQFDKHSFLIDGKAQLLISGSIHYFRSPAIAWRDLVHKSKMAGLNCMETYVAWNFHEYQENKYDFSGDRDFERFISICEDEEMYIIVRPGPYICAEWDLGGYPNWLLNKDNIELRTDNPDYLKLMDRWFDVIVPIITRHQITKGGWIIAVQVENEYAIARQGGHEGQRGKRYMEHIRDGFIARGIDVPLITCAGGLEGTIECANSHRPADLFSGLRAAEPDKPLFSTEFWTAWYDVWGGEHKTRPGYDLAAETQRIFAEGGCGCNYYMWHGGTNFGYSTMYLQTTSYDYDAPLSEAGGVTDKCREIKKIVHSIRAVESLVLASDPCDVPEEPAKGVRVWARKNERGRVLFLHNTDAEVKQIRLTLCGRDVEGITLGPHSSRILPEGLQLDDGFVLSWSTLPVLKFFMQNGHPVLMVYGEKGEIGRLLLQRHGVEYETEVIIPSDGKPVLTRQDSISILAVDSEFAGKTWFLPAYGEIIVVFGPWYASFASRTSNGLEIGAEITDSDPVFVFVNGMLLATHPTASASEPKLPTLEDWMVLPGSPEVAPECDLSGWTTTHEPVSMIKLGNGSEGYGWYRTVCDSSQNGRAAFTFTECADVLTVFTNGIRVGQTVAPEEDRTSPWTQTLEIPLKKGQNTICVLAGNLGLAKGAWQIGRPMEQEAKGIFGPVLKGGSEEKNDWSFIGRLNGERLRYPSDTSLEWSKEAARGKGPEWELTWWKAAFEIQIPPPRPLFLNMKGMGKGVIWLNGHNIGRYWQIGPQLRYYLPTAYLKQENSLVLVEEDGHTPHGIFLEYDPDYPAQPCRLIV